MSGYVKIDDIIEGLRNDELIMIFSIMSADQRVDAFKKGLKKEYSLLSNHKDKTNKEE